MQLIKKYTPGTGIQHVVKHGEGGLAKSKFDLLMLTQGEVYKGNTENSESAFVILSGSCHLSGEGFRFENIGSRKNVFSGKPTTVYLPIQSVFQIEAVTTLEIAICSAEADVKKSPVLITPDKVKEIQLGAGNWKRKAFFVIDQEVDVQHLFLGETYLPPGKWAFPPHRHDFNNLPKEVDMEEIYHFRILPHTGFGIQLSYTDDRSREEAYIVRNGDTVIIPDGYHPAAASPVDAVYFLWFMAGEKRLFLSQPEETYRWVIQHEAFLKSSESSY